MTSEELKKIYMTNEELGEAEVANITEMVANFKRAIEIVCLLPEGKELFYKDSEEFKKKYNLLDVDTKGIMQTYDLETAKGIVSLSEDEQLKEITYQAFRYRQFNNNKIVKRNKLLEVYNVPTNSKMKKWRERQIERSKGFSGNAYSANVHIVASYELTDGCSVGCPFCGVGAKKLKSVFTYDDDNAKLFRSVLKNVHEVIGDAAGRGAMYLDCEPLDNKDYESFLNDFLNEFKVLPQITTAVPLRDVDRVHSLLKQLNEDTGITYYRFSVKSVKEAEEIMKEFTPLELLKVELLPQYEEAPDFKGFANSGRERDRNESGCGEAADQSRIISSICCVSGFVINFARRDVRLITPYPASDKYPEGVVVLDKRPFADAEDLREIILSMINEHMVNVIPIDKILKPYDYLCLEGDAISSNVGYARPIHGPIQGFEDVAKLLFEGKYNKKNIAEILYKTKKMNVTETYFCLTTLFKNGVINEYE